MRGLLARKFKRSEENSGILIERCTKFYNAIHVTGRHATHKIRSIHSLAPTTQAVVYKTDGRSFSAQILFNGEPTGAEVIEILLDGGRAQFRLIDEARAGDDTFFANKLWSSFHDYLDSIDQPKVLDIGGRDRSKVDRSKSFPRADVCVLDVLPGDNVDVVGDAHTMSTLFPKDNFDAAYAVAVFEHLFMPWRVALEMNAVIKKGGLGYILTHQTIGMHDMPWDFWRYSDTAWDAIFNEYTGFKIVGRVLYSPSYILPFTLVSNKIDAERACGFEGSAVLVEKIGEPRVTWDVPPSIISTMYPSN